MDDAYIKHRGLNRHPRSVRGSSASRRHRLHRLPVAVAGDDRNTVIDRNTTLLETTPRCSKFSRPIVGSFFGINKFSIFEFHVVYFLHANEGRAKREFRDVYISVAVAEMIWTVIDRNFLVRSLHLFGRRN